MFGRGHLGAVLFALCASPSCVVSFVAADSESSLSEESEGEGRDPLSAGYELGTTNDGDGDGDGEGDGDGDGDPDSCSVDSPCPEGEYCWADYSAGGGQAPSPDQYACAEECVPVNDPAVMNDSAEDYWCLDSASCCGGGECDLMGYCGEAVGDGDGDGDGDIPPP